MKQFKLFAISMLQWNALIPCAFASGLPKNIITGSLHACLLYDDGKIKCWGMNNFGQLGTGDTEDRGRDPFTMGKNLRFVDLGTNIVAKDMCAGDLFSCAVTQNGKVKCWGANYEGALGQGNTTLRDNKLGDKLPYTNLGTNFEAKSITCGASHACAASSAGTVKCWGRGHVGQLGLGDAQDRGTKPSEMGDNLPFIANLSGVQAIEAGWVHTCAQSNEGVKCWGMSNSGQVGLESTNTVGNTPETIPAKIPYLKLNSTPDDRILNIFAGLQHNCALFEKTSNASPANYVKCRGENDLGLGIDGILGTGDRTNYGKIQNSMGDRLPKVNLGMDNIVVIAPHRFSTCALNKQGRVKCWGGNQRGTLGLGDTLSRGSKPTDMGANLLDVDLGLPVKAISKGMASMFSCAILINNSVKCWGSGGYGATGYENTDDVGVNAEQMGENLPTLRLE